LVVRNQLAHLFREKQWTYAKDQLDRLQHDFEKGLPLQWTRGRIIDSIDTWTLQEAQIIFNELYRKKDIKVRVENPRLQIYSNDIAMLNRLASKLGNCLELWTPSTEVALIPANTIVLDRPMPYEYRITLGSWTNTDFADWIDINREKIKIGDKCYKTIKEGGYTQGLYFYIRNERYLHLLQLIIGDSIQRVDKVIYKQNIDK
jgi:hypothetical protein